MSHSDRDQPGGHPIRHAGTYSCGCCRVVRPASKSSSRALRERDAHQLLDAGEGDLHDPSGDELIMFDEHVYEGERCIRCNVNVYDVYLYGPEHCPDRDSVRPLVYSTCTGDPSVFDARTDSTTC